MPAREVVRSTVKSVVPTRFHYRLKRAWMHSATLAARRAFETAATEPTWAAPERLEELDRSYPKPPHEYGYDSSSFEWRGEVRASELLPLVPCAHLQPTAIELGSADGMVACFMAVAGLRMTALDLRTDLFDSRAAEAGVQFVQADATTTPFEEASFDFVYSYDSFEHFDEPDAVLREAIRITKPGGRIYLRFGPLYMSPFGLHAYRSLGIPYCQMLFPRARLEEYADQRSLIPIPFDDVNQWTLDQFRELWAEASELEAIRYREVPHTEGLELVRELPSCFRSKTDLFDNLLVSHIEALFQRRHAGA